MHKLCVIFLIPILFGTTIMTLRNVLADGLLPLPLPITLTIQSKCTMTTSEPCDDLKQQHPEVTECPISVFCYGNDQPITVACVGTNPCSHGQCGLVNVTQAAQENVTTLLTCLNCESDHPSCTVVVTGSKTKLNAISVLQPLIQILGL